MPQKKRLTQKMITAMQLIAKGSSKRQAMLKAGYAESVAKNPKKNLLDKPQVLTIIDTMKLTLEDEGINGRYLGTKLANFAKSDNAKVFFGAYDRIGKIVGIEPSQSQLNGIPKRQVTFTEWVGDQSPPQATQLKEDSNDDLIALDNIKLDKFSELKVDPEIDREAREYLDKYGEAGEEVIY